MRSFTLLAGLKNSSFAATCAWQPSVTRFKKTRGVLPIRSVTSRAIFMANLLGAKSSLYVDIVLRIWAFGEASHTVAPPGFDDVLDTKRRAQVAKPCLGALKSDGSASVLAPRPLRPNATGLHALPHGRGRPCLLCYCGVGGVV